MSFEKEKPNHQALVQGTSTLLTTFEYYKASEDSFDIMVYLFTIVFKHTKMFNDPDLNSKEVIDYYHTERGKRLLKAKGRDEQSIISSRTSLPSKTIRSVKQISEYAFLNKGSHLTYPSTLIKKSSSKSRLDKNLKIYEMSGSSLYSLRNLDSFPNINTLFLKLKKGKKEKGKSLSDLYAGVDDSSFNIWKEEEKEVQDQEGNNQEENRGRKNQTKKISNTQITSPENEDDGDNSNSSSSSSDDSETEPEISIIKPKKKKKLPIKKG